MAVYDLDRLFCYEENCVIVVDSFHRLVDWLVFENDLVVESLMMVAYDWYSYSYVVDSYLLDFEAGPHSSVDSMNTFDSFGDYLDDQIGYFQMGMDDQVVGLGGMELAQF